ncbi:MlaD family protein [Mycobacteroides abscessus]|uniref:hypothetical protein n=1 Tax=Mycobacteroides abscessus TaxID=36809 RepID=UPI0009CE12CB|nr:hypothetical protein [Mycobacteroides abscessus]SLG56249.1 Uncharacterised protein [Mycobacteroides abscessus subsp. abscessus]
MSELLRGTEEQQRRTLVRTGAAVALAATLIATVVIMLPKREPANTIRILLTTPSVGQGIDVDSTVLLRGAPVGAIIALNHHGELTDLQIRLNTSDIHGLTDEFGYDFRPKNTFGVSALSLTPRDGGSPLIEGQRIARAPEINATMSQMLSGQVNFVNKVLTDKLARFIGHSVNYTAATAPLIESGLAFTSLITQTQREESAVLLRRFNRILEPLPGFVDSVFFTMHDLRNAKQVDAPIDNPAVIYDSFSLIGTELFGKTGDLLGKHQREFRPGAEIARSFADAVSTMLQRSRGSARLDKLLAGLTEVYNGPNSVHSSQKSFKLKVVLEPLPVLEAVLPPVSDLDGVQGGPR